MTHRTDVKAGDPADPLATNADLPAGHNNEAEDAAPAGEAIAFAPESQFGEWDGSEYPPDDPEWQAPPLDPEVERQLLARDAMERPKVVGRIVWISAGAALAAGLLVFWLRDLRAFLGLTCGAALTIINFLWLEDTVTTVLRASPHPSPFKLSIRVLARFVLLGVALAASIYVAHFDALSVVGGFSVVVAGVMGEALLSLVRSLRDR
jgi:hypothetical protein